VEVTVFTAEFVAVVSTLMGEDETVAVNGLLI
jgi:hypothetical protein